MTSAITVSVCIPTYNRPELLMHCLHSVFAQTMLPQEIVIGDDSTNDRTARMIAEIEAPGGISINYRKNPPRPDAQRNLAAQINIHGIFERARSEWLYLIHDDDWLLSNAVEDLTKPISSGLRVDVVYGGHLVARDDGDIDPVASSKANPDFARVSKRAGSQSSALWAAVRQQMPTSFVVRASFLRPLGYATEGVSDGEFAFGVKAALHGAQFYHVDNNVYVYRRSKLSIGRGSTGDTASVDAAYMIWRYRHDISRVADDELLSHIRSIVYRAAVSSFLRRRRRLEALKWALHPRFGIRWFGRQGLGLLSALLPPDLRERIKSWLPAGVRVGSEAHRRQWTDGEE